MPSARVTMLMAVGVALGIGYLFFFEMRSETTPEQLRNQSRVLHFGIEDVQRIKVRRDAWTSVRIDRVDAQGFRVVEPVEGMTDAAAVMRLLSDLEFLKGTSVLAKDGAEDKSRYAFGLNPARLEVDLGLREGREIRLVFGHSPAVGTGVYLSVLGTDPVWVVGERVFNDASQLLDRVVDSSQNDPQEKESGP